MDNDPTRKYALVAGICYLLTFASSIPAVALIGPVLHDANGAPLLLGHVLRLLRWLEIALGWLAGLQLVGLFGNLIKKD